jgi:membrane fusion protein, multidrug efflux system
MFSAHRPAARATLLLFLALASLLAACGKAEAPPEPVRAVRTLTVGAEDAGGQLEYAAEVRARSETRLAFRVGGRVAERPVDLGDSVRAGQLLAQLDAADLRLSQEAARAGLNAAQITADQASADFKRFSELRQQGFISEAELERRRSQWQAAQAQAEQARAQAGVQGNQAAYTRLVAQAAGVVTAIDAEVGSVVAAGTPVLRVAWDGPRDVQFQVPEDRVAGMRALEGRAGALQVRFWGAEGTVPATLRELSAAADTVTRTFLAKADIGKAPVKLGQTATVLLNLPPRSGLVKLPLTAVWQHQGGSAVWLLDKTAMTVKAQPVKVAGAEGNQVLVAEGLGNGQVVVTAGVHTLTPGQKVKLYTATAAAAQ